MNSISLQPLGPTVLVGNAIECQVSLDNIEVLADIGAFRSEYGVPQPLRIDVALSIAPPDGDRLETTFDYAVIRDYALELAARRTNLIETFALDLARMCLANDLVMEAAVRVQKPRAVPDCLAGTQVKLRRT